MNPRIKHVEYQRPSKLVIDFNNGETKIFDFASYLKYPVFEPLKDESFCSKAKVFNGTVVWDDVVDFDPDTLYIESKTLEPA